MGQSAGLAWAYQMKTGRRPPEIPLVGILVLLEKPGETAPLKNNGRGTFARPNILLTLDE